MAGKLTDTRLRAIKGTGRVQKLSDGHGLYIHVSPTGSRLWRMAYSFDGKQKTLSFGRYPDTSLADARKRCAEARELLAKGIDPGAEKKRIKAEAAMASEIATRTFDAVANEWLEIQKDDWAESNYKKKLRIVGILSACIGEKPIAHIQPVDILAAIRPYDACGKASWAHSLAQTASQICRFARTCGYCMFNAADGLTGVLKPIRSKHHACITNPAEAGRLLRSIDEYQGSVSVLYALKILPYVVLRSTELRGAAWAEIDLDKAQWIVPASRKARAKDGGGMKCRIAHTVPLAPQVVRMFEELQAFRQGGPLCFPGVKSSTACIVDGTLLGAIRRMGFSREEMTMHGFRGTFSTLLNEKKLEWGFDSDIIESQLAHKEANAVRGAYNHAVYLEQRRRLMEKWADYLDNLKAGNAA